jgi:hypothetical protein
MLNFSWGSGLFGIVLVNINFEKNIATFVSTVGG